MNIQQLEMAVGQVSGEYTILREDNSYHYQNQSDPKQKPE